MGQLQQIHLVGLQVGGAETALINCDHTMPLISQGGNNMPPGTPEQRKFVQQNNGVVAFQRAGIDNVEGRAASVDVAMLPRTGLFQNLPKRKICIHVIQRPSSRALAARRRARHEKKAPSGLIFSTSARRASSERPRRRTQ